MDLSPSTQGEQEPQQVSSHSPLAQHTNTSPLIMKLLKLENYSRVRMESHIHRIYVHIEYFFLLLGKEIVGRRAEIIAKLNEVDGIQVPVWVSLEAKWQELLFRKAKVFKTLPTETERHREERLNEVIRKPLLALLADPHNPPHIIVSRACKYNKEVVKHRLSTPEIISNEHLDYFYLMIKQRISPEVTLPSSFILAPHIPGDWRVVEPEDTWPHTFIGYFPKKPFETEREREWRLNHEVRLAFKKTLGGLLSQKNHAGDT